MLFGKNAGGSVPFLLWPFGPLLYLTLKFGVNAVGLLPIFFWPLADVFIPFFNGVWHQCRWLSAVCFMLYLCLKFGVNAVGFLPIFSGLWPKFSFHILILFGKNAGGSVPFVLWPFRPLLYLTLTFGVNVLAFGRCFHSIF